MRDCKNCEWAIFDTHWGDFKCEQRQTYMYNTKAAEDCALYEDKINLKDIKIFKESDDHENLF